LYGGADKNTPGTSNEACAVFLKSILANQYFFPAFKDFCYTASLENFTWVYHSYLKLSDGSSAARAEHEGKSLYFEYMTKLVAYEHFVRSTKLFLLVPIYTFCLVLIAITVLVAIH
jgi:hypothetical protein